MATCASCAKMNLNDKNKAGNFWCGEYKKYLPGSESTCGDFIAREEESSGCFITTVVVECLGYDDYFECLKTLREFRDIVMKKEISKYGDLLLEYDNVGPGIANSIATDSQRVSLAHDLLNRYIKPVCSYVNDGNYEAAVELYKNMVVNLKQRYNL